MLAFCVLRAINIYAMKIVALNFVLVVVWNGFGHLFVWMHKPVGNSRRMDVNKWTKNHGLSPRAQPSINHQPHSMWKFPSNQKKKLQAIYKIQNKIDKFLGRIENPIEFGRGSIRIILYYMYIVYRSTLMTNHFSIRGINIIRAMISCVGHTIYIEFRFGHECWKKHAIAYMYYVLCLYTNKLWHSVVLCCRCWCCCFGWWFLSVLAFWNQLSHLS